jgi:MSHA biogenesis protein MshN
MGMGISLQALQHKEEARDAYQRALASNSLSAQLQAFVQQKIKEL